MVLEPLRLPNPMMAEESLDLLWRLIEDLDKRHVGGDIVEAGCNNGLTSLYIASVMEKGGRILHCYDFFAPVPAACVQLPEEAGESYVPTAQRKDFRQLFSEHPKLTYPKVHAGNFTATMPSELPEKIALALIDADYYASTRYALSQILPRMSREGFVAIHDWEQVKWGPGVQRAVHEIWKGPVSYKQGLAVIRT